MDSYILGHSAAELQRLTAQAEFLRPITERMLGEAGLRRGMRVLDLGCGAGDVMLAQVEQGRRTERHLTELRDELELMIKAELMGQLGMLRTEMGHRFDKLADRITVLEGGDPWQVGADSKPD